MTLCLWIPAQAQTTFDPLSISIGARALGMGAAYVAVAEDGDTIFTNPAGLGEIDSFKFISMSATLMGDVNYTLLGGVYPLGEKSAFGIGYTSASVTGIQVRDADGTLEVSANFGNTVLLASYGRKLGEKLSMGINLKYFSQDGSVRDGGDGSGINLDVGFLQKGLNWLSLGAVGKNILSSGKVRYASGEEAALPMTIKVGARMHLLGEEFQAAKISPVKLIAVADVNLSLEGSTPSSTHLGFELSPDPALTLRAGIDQDPKPGGIQSSSTYGVSLRFSGIGFHYAYHPFTDAGANATSFFSISFDERGWPAEGLQDIFMGDQGLLIVLLTKGKAPV